MISQDSLLIQGAEAKLFEGKFCGEAAIFKERFVKKYRLPQLDENLTKVHLIIILEKWSRLQMLCENKLDEFDADTHEIASCICSYIRCSCEVTLYWNWERLSGLTNITVQTVVDYAVFSIKYLKQKAH